MNTIIHRSKGRSKPKELIPEEEKHKMEYKIVPEMDLAILGEPKPPPKRNLLIDLLIIIFGMGTWIGVSSTNLQMPIIVQTAPEGWRIASFLALAVQSGNIGMILYVLYQKYSPKKLNDSHLCYILSFIGCIASICMAFFYQYTINISGEERSLALILLMWMFAFVSCTSNVVCMPYIGRFRGIYIVTFMVGKSLSGFLSSIIVLIQGVGDSTACRNTPPDPSLTLEKEPLFHPKQFFLFVFAWHVLTIIAFALLNNLKMSKKEYASVTISYGNDYSYDDKSENGEKNVPENVRNMSQYNYKMLMVITGIVYILGNGVLPGLQTYFALPYGTATYHLLVTIIQVVNPLSSALGMFVPNTSIRTVKILAILITVFALLLLSNAIQSPNPPLLGTMAGKVLIILVAVIFNGMVSFFKLSIAAILRYRGGKALVWLGTISQACSSIGAILVFVLVNMTNIFKSC